MAACVTSKGLEAQLKAEIRANELEYINLRYEPAKNNQKSNIWNCFDYIW